MNNATAFILLMVLLVGYFTIGLLKEYNVTVTKKEIVVNE